MELENRREGWSERWKKRSEEDGGEEKLIDDEVQ